MLTVHRGSGRKAVRILLTLVTLSFLCCSIGFAASGLDSRPTNTTCVALARPAGTNYQLTRVFSPMAFNRPVGVQQSPDNGQRWYVIEQSGRVMTFLNGDQQASVFVDVAQEIATAGGEQGLLGMAFHPSYPSVPYVYLSYTGLDGGSVISRFTKSGAGDFLEPSTEIMILQQPQPYANHNGGEIAFGPDGYLYIGLGDGGSGGDPLNNGQNTHTLLGAMLRIDVNAGSPYAIPPDNPFASSTGWGVGQGCPEIYAWGFRNPWRFSFDSTSGDLWVGDVGQALWEEVDLVRVERNYGWRCYEGTHAYNLTGCDPLASYEPPVIEYAHSDGNCSVIGGYVNQGLRFPNWAASISSATTAAAEFGLLQIMGG